MTYSNVQNLEYIQNIYGIFPLFGIYPYIWNNYKIMFQEEFTNTLNKLARRGMSEAVFYREQRKKRNNKQLSDNDSRHIVSSEIIQLKLFEL